MNTAPQRVAAARAIAAVMRGRSLDDALPPGSDGFTRALTYGVVREHSLLAHFCARLLDKAVTEELRALLLCGLYQLRSMDVAPHAAVNETVAACDALGQPMARGLVNAILRRWQREAAALERALPEDPALRSSHPPWLLRRLQADWPQQWPQILDQNNRQGPLVLRANRRRGGRAAYLEQLRAAGIRAQPVADAADAVELDVARGVDDIPGFAEGVVSVQDAAAQLAADFLELEDGQRVLDACAAPGGKTAQILERVAARVVAVDSDARRLARAADSLRRLGLEAQLITADAAQPAAWWDGEPFDRILLDAPCSASGVIRRHPDIKWLRRDSDVPRLAHKQGQLLAALWPLLRPGGVLLYATCSVFREEGDGVLTTFLQARTDAALLPLPAGRYESSENGLRIAPEGPFDGFYYAKLGKKTV